MISALLAAAAGPLAAAPPWRPQVTIDDLRRPSSRPRQRRPYPRARLSEAARRKFDRALAEAFLWLERGRYRRASTLFSRALEINRDNRRARLGRARAQLFIGYLHWNLPAVRQAETDLQWLGARQPAGGTGARLLELARNLRRRIERTQRLRAASRSRRHSLPKNGRFSKSPGKPGK